MIRIECRRWSQREIRPDRYHEGALGRGLIKFQADRPPDAVDTTERNP